MRIPERFLLSATLVALVSLLVATEWPWKIDQLFYDWKLQNSMRSPSPEILIVAIDEQSLDEIGRWPWPRGVHARIVEKLSAAGASVVGLDILFSEPEDDDIEGDGELVDAVAASGRVVLPTANVERRLGDQLFELLPFGALSEAAAAIGHVERQLDPDAIVRSAYLKAGLGVPRWSSFALAMLEVADPGKKPELVGLRAPPSEADSSMMWVRDYQIWIPFAGPPGTIPRVSYTDVLNDRVPAEAFSGAMVVVGATAVGLGDLLPTPVSGHGQPMPGVEIVANELDVLLKRLEILPLGTAWRWCAAVIFVLAPLLLFPRVPRWSLLVWGGFIVLNVGFSMLLLGYASLWYAPASALIVQLLSYPLWSWRRLVQTVMYLNRALQALHGERIVPESIPGLPLSESMSFIQSVVPLEGAVVLDISRKALDVWGNAPELPEGEPPAGDRWQIQGSDAWIRIDSSPDDFYFGIRSADAGGPASSHLSLLTPIALKLKAPATEKPRNVVEYIQRRIQQVQEATEKIQFMRRFVTDTLSEMALGVVVTDGLGHVMLANARAERYLGIANGDRLERREITEFLFQLETSEAGNWPNILHGVMVDGKPAELSARAPNGLQLLIQLSSFAYNPEMNRGLLISLADVSALRESERQRGELTAFISHDLRSPLSSIVAIAGIARADPRRIGEAMIERIENHAYRTLALVDDVLEFNRLQTAEWKEFRNVNLSAAAYQAIDSVSDRIAAREIKLFRRLPDEAIVTGDDALIERAVINLLDNAIKYSPPNSEITVEIRETEDDMRCTVSDTGYGIPDEDLHKIFERYQRSSSNHHARQPGVGLGLSFVRVCMERHRGRVDVETQVDQGTSFTLVFPRADG